MRSVTKPVFLALVSAGLLVMAPARSGAGLISYTETVQANGSLGGSTFTNAMVTLTFLGDTANVPNPSSGIYRNSVGTATVMVNGTTATLTGPVDVFVNQTNNTAGIETFATVLTVQNPVLTGYALASPIGPLTGSSGGTLNTNFATSGGSLDFTFLATSASFQASTPSSVPEPASFLMLGLGIAGMVVIGWRSVVGQSSCHA